MKIKKIVYLFIIVAVIISFMPLLKIAEYNCPSADDYNYAVTTYKIWNETHSVTKVLKEAVNTSIRFWHNWQGLYVSAFLLALQPAVFGQYCITGYLMIGLIVGSTCCFSVYFLKRILKRNLLEAITYGMVMSFCMIQFMPSCVQGLYWFNGAVNYGFFFSILLVYICALTEYQMFHSKVKDWCLFIFCVIAIFILEGGNHVTALMGVVFTFGVMLITLKKSLKKTIGNGILFVMSISFLMLNICSPGTVVRQTALKELYVGCSFFETIIKATQTTLNNINEWIGLREIAVVVVLLPIIFPMVKYIREKYNFRFKYPLLVVVASVAWLAIMYCPPYFAMNSSGEGRLINIVYFCFVILFNIDVIYIIGWIREKLDSSIQIKMNANYFCVVLTLAFAVFITCGEEMWGYEAALEWYLRETQQYFEEYQEREKIFLNSKGQQVTVKAYTVCPEILYLGDIEEDSTNWTNVSLAKYYDLESVVLTE